MAVPKRRTSKSKKKMRRSHHALKVKNYVISKETGFPVLSHQVDPNTGKYKGRQILKKEN